MEAHRSCWQLFLESHDPGEAAITVTPEFGPDAYMPLKPFSAEPVADVETLNRQMATWLRQELKG